MPCGVDRPYPTAHAQLREVATELDESFVPTRLAATRSETSRPSPPPTGRLPAAEEDASMLEQDNTTTSTAPQSVTERHLRGLIVPVPGAYDPSKRFDVTRAPDLEPLWGGPE
jgi:hypothetical protein